MPPNPTTTTAIRRRSVQPDKSYEDEQLGKPAAINQKEQQRPIERHPVSGKSGSSSSRSDSQGPSVWLSKFFQPVRSNWRLWSSLAFVAALLVILAQVVAPDDVLQVISTLPKSFAGRQHPIPRNASSSTATNWYHRPFLEYRDPFARPPKPRTSRSRLLFLHEAGAFNEALDVYRASLAHPHIAGELWSADSAGYNEELDIVTNVERKWGCGHFDVVYMLHSLQTQSENGNDWSQSLTRPFGCGTILAAKVGDCSADECIGNPSHWYRNVTAVRHGPDLTQVFPYHKLLAQRKTLISESDKPAYQLYAQITDSAHAGDYHPPSRWADKTNDATTFDSIGFADTRYALRNTIANAIERKKTFVKFFNVSDDQAADNASSTGQSSTKRDSDTASIYRNAKICVIDGSNEKRFLRAHAQASLSGCVIAGQVPSDHGGGMREHMIVLDSAWPIAKINKVLKSALADPVSLRRKASFMYAYAQQHLTSIRELDTLLDIVNRYRAGERGYITTADFNSVCQSVRTQDGYPSAQSNWCSGQTFAT